MMFPSPNDTNKNRMDLFDFVDQMERKAGMPITSVDNLLGVLESFGWFNAHNSILKWQALFLNRVAEEHDLDCLKEEFDNAWDYEDGNN